MTKYLAGVLSVIAGGVLLVAWGLLSPRASAFTYPNQNPYGVQAAYAYGAQPSFAGSTVPCANGMQVTYQRKSVSRQWRGGHSSQRIPAGANG